MKKIFLERIQLENFKGIRNLNVRFKQETNIFGANGTGKTTIQDAFCWLLFDKDASGRNGFEVRPLNPDNTLVNDVEISVAVLINVIDEHSVVQYELCKTQVQKWKKDPQTGERVLSGNANKFFIDGFSKTSKEFNAFVAELIPTDLFQMLADPLVFPNMAWKQQREVLTRLVDGVTDLSLAQDPRRTFSPLVQVLSKGYSASDVLDRDKKQKNALLKEIAGIPERKEELLGQMVEKVDVIALQERKAELQKDITVLNEHKVSGNGAAEARAKLESEIADIQRQITSLKNFSYGKWMNDKRVLERKVNDAKYNLDNVKYDINDLKASVERLQNSVSGLETQRADMLTEYQSIKAEEFDGTQLFCKTCGQALPEDKVSELRNRFEENKSARLEKNISNGKTIKGRIEILNEEIQKNLDDIQKKTDSLDLLNIEVANAEKALSGYPAFDETSIDGISELQSKLADLQKQAAVPVDDESAANRQIDAQISDVYRQISDIDRKIAGQEQNDKLADRFNALEKHRIELLKESDMYEKEIALLEQLISEKLKLISDEVNSKFKLVDWKLFDVQLNGAVNECCTCTVDGVPFSALNSAMKINAGLDIINTISQIYGYSVPIFIDNRESVTEITPVQSQVINLIVSAEDKEIRVAFAE